MIDIEKLTDAECRVELTAQLRDRAVESAARAAGALFPEQAIPFGRASEASPKDLIASLKENHRNLFEDLRTVDAGRMSPERYQELRSTPEGRTQLGLE